MHQANIEITRDGNLKLRSISVIMPTWSKQEQDNSLSIILPFFGIKTFSKNHESSVKSSEEAITLFCKAAEKFGNGLEAELQFLGWEIVSNNDISTIMEFTTHSNVVMDCVLETGEPSRHKLEILELA